MKDDGLKEMLKVWLYSFVRPRATFSAMVDTPRKYTGLVALSTLAVMYTILFWVLASSKSVPSHTAGLITEPEMYYKTAANYIFPLIGILWVLFTSVSHGVAKLFGGTGEFDSVVGALGISYSLPILVFLVIPDMVFMAVGGHELLTASIRYTAALTALSLLILSTHAIRGVHRIGWGGAITSVVVGVVIHAPLAGWLIR